VLDGRYVLEGALGSGAMSIMYRATRIADGATFAIKELSLRRLESLKRQELFEREARVLRELDHEGVPACHDEFVWGVGKHQAFYIVEEFIDGHTLAGEMASTRYSEDDVLALIAELSRILAYLHERRPPIIHRDLKPDNIMRREDGRLVVIDFGVVRDAFHGSVGGSTVAGTFGYMAPEVFVGKAYRASDLYSLGIIALVMLTRKQPHEMMTKRHELAWRSHVDATPAMKNLLAALLEPDHERRISDARALSTRASALRRGVHDVPAPAAPAPAPPTATALAVRVEDRAIAAHQSSHESLFGFALVAMVIPIMGLPCLIGMFGILPSASIVGTLLFLLMIILPFLPREAPSEVPEARRLDP